MRYADIVPTTHPHIAILGIDPVDFQKLERLTDDRPEVRLLDVDDSEPDHWIVRVGCASSEVASRLEDGWT